MKTPPHPNKTTHEAYATRWAYAALIFICWLRPWQATGSDGIFQVKASVGISYTNIIRQEGPWSIHVVQIDRADRHFSIRTAHADGHALGCTTLSEQLGTVQADGGSVVAAVNGDFYERDRAYAGDPRGTQIMDQELLSAPSGGATFWIDAAGQPHIANVESGCEVLWPGSPRMPLGLNEELKTNRLVLYTPAAGLSTHTAACTELILQPEPNTWKFPMRVGEGYTAVIHELKETGNSLVKEGQMILSIPKAMEATLPPLKPGGVLRIKTGSYPSLKGSLTAIGGGPILLEHGRSQKLPTSSSDSYAFNSMKEKHPRSAFAWNEKYFFLVEVDGRQKSSAGMTLNELGQFLITLGCTDAMNLDGGGSATLWFEGKVRNNPCDGRERPIANSLVVVHKS